MEKEKELIKVFEEDIQEVIVRLLMQGWYSRSDLQTMLNIINVSKVMHQILSVMNDDYTLIVRNVHGVIEDVEHGIWKYYDDFSQFHLVETANLSSITCAYSKVKRNYFEWTLSKNKKVDGQRLSFFKHEDVIVPDDRDVLHASTGKPKYDVKRTSTVIDTPISARTSIGFRKEEYHTNGGYNFNYTDEDSDDFTSGCEDDGYCEYDSSSLFNPKFKDEQDELNYHTDSFGNKMLSATDVYSAEDFC